MQSRDYIDANRRAWNQVAPIHARANLERLLRGFAQPGFSVLDAVETAKLAEIGVAGKAVAQLACNNGRELLSIKNLGAGRCVGFDIAEEFISQAQELNALAGLDCEFVATSIYDIPERYNQAFDLVYVTIGVLSWLPDLNTFWGVVARLLRPQGKVMIYEMHPFTNMLDLPEQTSTPLQISLSYFNPDVTEDKDGLDYYSGTSYDALPNYWFAHTLSDILMGMVNNGMALVSFEEYAHDISAVFKPLEQYGKVPLCYILVGEKR